MFKVKIKQNKRVGVTIRLFFTYYNSFPLFCPLKGHELGSIDTLKLSNHQGENE